MVKDHSDSERGNPLPPHGLLFSINGNDPTDRITYTTAFVTPVVEHWLQREIAQRVHPTTHRNQRPILLYFIYLKVVITNNIVNDENTILHFVFYFSSGSHER